MTIKEAYDKGFRDCSLELDPGYDGPLKDCEGYDPPKEEEKKVTKGEISHAVDIFLREHGQ